MFTFGSFRLAPDQRQLFRDDEPVLLPAKALSTLLLLVEHRDRVVEKDEILAAVWPDSFVSDDSLTQVVSLLRRTLGDDSSQPTIIATIPRRGYRFVADVAEVRPELAPARPVPETSSPAPSTPVSGRDHLRWPLIPLGVAAAVALLLVIRSTPATTDVAVQTPIRFVQAMPGGATLASGGEVSPDGLYLAFVAQQAATGSSQLWIRALDTPAPKMLAGTEGAFRPFWSPDSQSIAFFADGKLKRVDISGALPRTITTVGYRPAGGSWSSTGLIAYADRVSQLFSVPENGGPVVDLTVLDASAHETGHHSPHFLPDGQHYLFFVSNVDPAQSGTYLGRVGSQDRVKLLDDECRNAVYANPGYLLYVRDNVLVAHPFDVDEGRFTGAPIAMPSVNASGEDGESRVGSLSVSTNGGLAFGGDQSPNSFVWMSRNGRQLSTIAMPDNLHNPVLSADNRSLLADGNGGLWLADLERGASTRVVTAANLPTWLGDGARVAFTSRRDRTVDIYVRSLSGPEDETLLVRSSEMKIAGNGSGNGRYFVYASSNPRSRLDLWTLTMSGHGATSPFLQSPSNELQPQISPDGHWVAYTSDESGAWEVYVQSFPVPGRKRTISVNGGAQPAWRRDGRELFYLAPDGTLMAVPVTTGENLDAGRPIGLFKAPIAPDIILRRNRYAVASDGSRFVVDVAHEPDPVNVVVNWRALVRP